MGKVLHVEDLFTEERESEGVWYQPKIKGIPCGLEFLITGAGSDENLANSERYEKAMIETEAIKDPVEKVKKQKEIDANRVAEFVHGIKAAEGCEFDFKGKPLEFSVPFIQELLRKSPLLKMEIIKFAKETTNFMKREKRA